MNSPKLKVVTVSPIASPLDIARETVADLQRRLAAIADERAKAVATTHPVEIGAEAAQGLRQRLKGVFARMLDLGRLDTDQPEVAELTSELAARENDERQAVAIAEARQDKLRALDAQATSLQMRVADAGRDLEVAQLQALNAEIAERHVAEIRRKANELANAIGGAYGAARLSWQLHERLKSRRGMTIGPMGTEHTASVITLTLVNFGFADGGGFNQLKLDCAPATEASYAEHLQRFGSS